MSINKVHHKNVHNSIVSRFVAYIFRHLQQAVGSLGEIWRTPFSSVMTILVLGISLALPVTLHLFVKNAQIITKQWDSASEISLFLVPNISDKAAQNFVNRIKLYPEIADVRFISAKQALTEFKMNSGFGQALDYLSSNPLPATVIVIPTKKSSQVAAAQELLDKLKQTREVEQGKLDLEWLTRLAAIATLIEDIVIGIGILLSFSVILIVGNTIRLAILNQKEAIAVMKLVGATDSFIQRPFLYSGMWYGILGGIVATLSVALLAWYLSNAIRALSNLYHSQFELQSLSFAEVLIVIGVAVMFGLAGSFISVRKHIRTIEPTAD